MLQIRSFYASDTDFPACLAIREEIFVGEQGVPAELEHDSHDATALHFLGRLHGAPVATARVLLKDNGATAKIGRVAVRREHRGSGLGRDMILAIEASPQLAHVTRFALDAQIRALNFYLSLGYVAEGPEFLDAGIVHRHMTKLKNSQPG
eukprot:gene23256-24640_t